MYSWPRSRSTRTRRWGSVSRRCPGRRKPWTTTDFAGRLGRLSDHPPCDGKAEGERRPVRRQDPPRASACEVAHAPKLPPRSRRSDRQREAGQHDEHDDGEVAVDEPSQPPWASVARVPGKREQPAVVENDEQRCDTANAVEPVKPAAGARSRGRSRGATRRGAVSSIVMPRSRRPCILVIPLPDASAQSSRVGPASRGARLRDASRTVSRARAYRWRLEASVIRAGAGRLRPNGGRPRARYACRERRSVRTARRGGGRPCRDPDETERMAYPSPRAQRARGSLDGVRMLRHVLASGERHLSVQSPSEPVGLLWWKIVIWGRWTTFQPALPYPEAEVGLLAVEEEPLVHPADGVDRRLPREHERADCPIAAVSRS